MAIDYEKFNAEFGGAEALKALKEAQENNTEFAEVPDGIYMCKLEKLELGKSKSGKPLIKGQFRIVEGAHKKQCLFVNQLFCRTDMGSGFPIHKGLEFLRSLQIFDRSEIDFNGDYKDFADLLLDLAENAEGMKFQVEKSMDGEYTRLDVLEAFD